MSILIFAPHPDDEVLGCGGSIVQHAAAGRRVHVVFLSSGEQGVPDTRVGDAVVLREKEARQAAGVLGVGDEHLHFLRLPDGGLDPAGATQLRTVLALLRELRPEVVYLPHAGDGSFDHHQAHRLVWRALEMSGSQNHSAAGRPHWVPVVLGYEVWAPLFRPSLLVDINEAADPKERALACYGSQNKGPGQAEHTTSGALAMPLGGHREAFAVERISPLAVAW